MNSRFDFGCTSMVMLTGFSLDGRRARVVRILRVHLCAVYHLWPEHSNNDWGLIFMTRT